MYVSVELSALCSGGLTADVSFSLVVCGRCAGCVVQNRLPGYTSSTKRWMASSWFGSSIKLSPAAGDGAGDGGGDGGGSSSEPHQLTQAENDELDQLYEETERLAKEWEDSFGGKAAATKTAQQQQAAASGKDA